MSTLLDDFIFNFDDLASNITLDTNNIYMYEHDYILCGMQDSKITMSNLKNNYIFNLKRNRFTNKKSLIIICSKNNSNILNYSLEKLQKYNILAEHDVLLVDDRSSNNDILDLSDKFKTSYLRINNTLDLFNYAVINNIASTYAYMLNKELIIFLNNDLYPSSPECFTNLLNKHYSYQSNISGCRLLYPNEQDYVQMGKPQHRLNNKINEIYGTIQHGGIIFLLHRMLIDQNRYIYTPDHLWRFNDKNTSLAKTDNRCYAVTGAIQLIDTKTFISLSGFNNCLGYDFQDIDLCLRAVENDLNVHYIGSEFMYHAESLTVADVARNNTQYIHSDHIIWDMCWRHKIDRVLGYPK